MVVKSYTRDPYDVDTRLGDQTMARWHKVVEIGAEGSVR